MAEIRAGQSQADGGGRAETVGGFQGDEAAPRAHQGGSRAEQFPERLVERVRARQAFGELVQGREVEDPAGETVLEQRARRVPGVCRRGGRGTRDGRDSVCG
ncbi:hypothetical protein SHKM778_92830 [Streptomyces sp. KM77-8]|uniref:Uncharacterized protein n=1 Tax=Streptomyces haneummycinicus TaxID=3074435 RepID=A0AAT9I059_9ACTN